jgi:hypothetical protein
MCHIVEEKAHDLIPKGIFKKWNVQTATILFKKFPKNREVVFNPDPELIPKFWPNPDLDRSQNVNPAGLYPGVSEI